ncbi:type IV pilus assembly protein PilY1 [Natronospira proteinivora]|uniref:Type IV pilus assembly protein PilY1 n=1 Tax=Natronospira proteinivora TaxID=1807133 RepID=A0ABT1G4Q9_9GAMM|nr:PilC/PilY family type IV pilus protein [Natronospira proteinivora]MCP1726274.1 type IV pilus assembly protein PilY1 [Natronospira proteinivora]
MKLSAFAFAMILGLMAMNVAFANIARVPLFVTEGGLPPNILFIPDTSESMQEGLSQGRVGLDWDECYPGPDMDPDECLAGARHEDSKASIVKRVGLEIIDEFGESGQINMGLLSYQQYPASHRRNDVFPGHEVGGLGTVRWRLMHRIADARFSTDSDPDFFQPDHDEAWDSGLKRFREPHPTRDNAYIFYNVAVPGYHRETSGNWENDDRTYFCRYTGTNFLEGDEFPYDCYNDLQVYGDDNIAYQNEYQSFNVTLTDSMRQRGVDNWGENLVYVELGQFEWRANASPGLGFLHVPLGGIDEDGEVEDDHWDAIRDKLQPQRHNWSTGGGDVVNDPDWPLIAAGLTPLEGTMHTARDYFLGEEDYFSQEQGRTDDDMDIPRSCDANAAIWVTDGLPSVDASGNALGENPVEAMQRARDAVADFHDDTDVRTFIVGFALPPGVGDLFEGVEGFDTDNPLDVLAEAGGTGSAFDAGSEGELQSIMDGIFELVVSDARSSAASIATNSTRLDTESLAFLASFDTTNWSGELEAYEITQEGVLGDLRWEAEDGIPDPYSRHVITWDPDDGDTLYFEWDHPSGRHLTDDQKAALNQEPYSNDVDGQGQDRLYWLRGDQTNEGEGAFRERQRLLGDIVNSDPLFVQTQDFGYYHEENFEGGLYYFDHVRDMREHRPMLYVAANDGKLHGFDAENGEEVFAYVPNAIIHKLNRLTSEDYQREYFFDGSPRVGDVWDGSDWRRILVGSFAAGERGVYALDITDPESPEVLWEATAEDYDDIGYVIGEPSLGVTQSDDWVVIVPSGYGSNNNRAALTFLDPITGNEVDTWAPDDGDNPAGNGMASPVPVDVNGDRKLDHLYMGDLQGQLWRLDLTGNNWRAPDGLRSGNTPLPLFVAEGPNEEVQPITVRPQVARSPEGDIFVYFGTGKYFEDEDNLIPNNPPVQSFYGIRDDESEVSRGDLLEQEIIDEIEDFGFELRVTTENEISDEDGWLLDLVSPVAGREAERVIFNPVFRNGRIIFTTMIPSEDPCAAGGDGWLMEIDAFSGGRLDFSPFDLSGDGEFGEDSYVEVEIDGEMVRVPISGIRSEVGIPTTPAIISAGHEEFKMMMGSEAAMQALPPEKGDDSLGRQSWRQNR